MAKPKGDKGKNSTTPGPVTNKPASRHPKNKKERSN